jgi:peptidoglycan lytic transglycosylase G
MKKLMKFLMWAVLLFLVLFAATLLYQIYMPYSDDRPAPIVVKKGMSVSKIASTLDTAGVIPSEFAFIVAAKFSEKGTRLQSGVYLFPEENTIIEVLDILASGSHQVEKWITIPEGSSVKAIAKILERKLGIDQKEVLRLSRDRIFIRSLSIRSRSLEGYLLPDTYRFKITASAEDILRYLASQMSSFVSQFQGRIDSLKQSRHSILTMASIVEGETRLAEERSRVAGVYYNRLRAGMLLQADPTVQYAIPDGPRRLLYRDLKINSKYNTYRFKGLPPGPINNPGREAIKAALYPERHAYIFFVADGKGGHIFSRNAGEHQRAVAQYRRHQRSQQVN